MKNVDRFRPLQLNSSLFIVHRLRPPPTPFSTLPFERYREQKEREARFGPRAGQGESRHLVNDSELIEVPFSWLVNHCPSWYVHLISFPTRYDALADCLAIRSSRIRSDFDWSWIWIGIVRRPRRSTHDKSARLTASPQHHRGNSGIILRSVRSSRKRQSEYSLPFVSQTQADHALRLVDHVAKNRRTCSGWTASSSFGRTKFGWIRRVSSSAGCCEGCEGVGWVRMGWECTADRLGEICSAAERCDLWCALLSAFACSQIIVLTRPRDTCRDRRSWISSSSISFRLEPILASRVLLTTTQRSALLIKPSSVYLTFSISAPSNLAETRNGRGGAFLVYCRHEGKGAWK